MLNIAGGDWRFFFPENVTNFSGIPSAWDASLNTGIGMPALNTLWISGYLYFSSLLSKLGFSWNAISLLCWIIPSILIGFVSVFLLYKYFWEGKNRYAFLASIIYVTNTYFLMILSGGQLGVVLSYGFVPLVFFRFLKNIDKPTLFNSIFFGLVLSLQILFDPRIALVTFFILIPFLIGNVKKLIRDAKFTIILPMLCVLVTHAYWILPILIFYLGSNIQPSIYKGSNNFSFFSFATLENSLSLLHPNWPENLFGKIHFMRPEYILIPLLAFVSLLNKRSKQVNKIVVVVFIALLSAFLAKGVNDPFGIFYVSLLKHVPGFSAFRDPTKFYIPVAICYALLIPVGLGLISGYVSKFKRFKKNAEAIVAVMFVAFWFVLLFPLIQGQVGGIFRLRTVSVDYVNYKNFITQQPEFFRTLWIPQIQRFGYFSNYHPAIGRGEIFKDQTLKGMLRELSLPGAEQKLSDLSVKYVVVPSDSESELFVDDGKFDKKQYESAVSGLEKITYLTKERAFGSLVVFKTKTYNQHFKFTQELSSGRILILSSKPSSYKLSILPFKGEMLIFGDSYDRNWIMKTPTETVRSENYNGLNSFKMQNNNNQEVEISYAPQKVVNVLSVFSLILVTTTAGYLIVARKRK